MDNRKTVDAHYLELLAKEFPNVRMASTEIVNLNAILSLPKGTEYFLSDLHGEHEAFIHMVQSASGVINNKINELFGKTLSDAERRGLAALVYDAVQRWRAGSERRPPLTNGAGSASTALWRSANPFPRNTRAPRSESGCRRLPNILWTSF
jgi:hypothetical protein